MQPAPVEDALQVHQIGVLVVVDKQEVKGAGGKAMLAGQRIERVAAVANSADHTRDSVGHASVGPDLAGIGGVDFGKLDGVHLGGGRGARDAQRTVAAVGAQLERQSRFGAPDGYVEQHAFFVADVNQHRLLVGEPVDGCQDVVHVARASVLQHV